MRVIKRRGFAQDEVEYAWRRQRQLLDTFADRICYGAANRSSNIENRDLAGAFGPEGADRGCAFIEINLDRNHILRERQAVSLEPALRDTTVVIDSHLLVESIAQALHHPALDLAVDSARVECAANVLDDLVRQDLDMAGVWVDGDLAIVDGEDRNINCIDEVPCRASCHRGNAGRGEGAAGADRSMELLRPFDHFRDGRT